MDRWTITDAKVITPGRVIEPGYVTIDAGRIAAVGGGAPDDAGRKVSANGATMCPGLMDIHLHGTGGHWAFFDKKDLIEMAKSLTAYGVTAFCPATVSLPHKQVVTSVKLMREAMGAQSAGSDYTAVPTAAPETGARILGINLEGPYINKLHPGAHIPACIRDPKEEEINEVLDAAGGAIRIFTLAPELPGGMALTKKLSDAGIVVSIGHSDADRQQTLEAVRNGAKLMTHLFNALRGFHQREPGNSFTSLLTAGLFCELIADGKHVHPDVVRMASMVKPSSEIILITDSISAAGQGPGKYNVWGFTVEVKDGLAQLPDGTIAGSVLTLNRGVANMSEFSGLPLERCVEMATYNPANLLGLLPHAGHISPGTAADIALFDDDMNCLATVIAGHVVYNSDKSPLS